VRKIFIMQIQDQPRNDLHLTSVGKGHAYREPLTFPPANFNRTVNGNLPPLLNETCVRDFYITTTGTSHNFKPSNSAGRNNGVYKKAAGHWKVSYNEDTIKKIQVKPQRKQLTMSNQSSEMKSQYTNQKGISLETAFSNDMQPPLYKHHNTNGPLKSLVPSTQNKDISGQRYKVQDRGVLSYHGDYYLTTTQKDHRPFTLAEQRNYPKKEYGTYWECEGYPKSWGHGSKQNPLPPDSVKREKEPMRDAIWFKTATTIPRLPKPLKPVVHNGMKSEMSANFIDIPSNKRLTLFQPMAPPPWDIKSAGKEEIYSVPKMYKTEYQSIGKGRTVVV